MQRSKSPKPALSHIAWGYAERPEGSLEAILKIEKGL